MWVMKPQRWILHKLCPRGDWELCTYITIVWLVAVWNPSTAPARLGPVRNWCICEGSQGSDIQLAISFKASKLPHLCWWYLLLGEKKKPGAQEKKQCLLTFKRCYCMSQILRRAFSFNLFVPLKLMQLESFAIAFLWANVVRRAQLSLQLTYVHCQYHKTWNLSLFKCLQIDYSMI